MDREKADECGEVLKFAEKGDITAIITVFSLHSIAVILEDLESVEKYRIFLETIGNFNGLYIHSLTTGEEIKACKDTDIQKLNFDDSYQYRTAKNLNINLITLDEDFEDTDIETFTPGEVVKIENKS